MLGFISSPDLERLRFQTNARERTFSPRQERFRGRNDRAQRRRHLKTNQDENEAPDSEMTFALCAKEAAHRVDQAQAETDADHPKEQMQRPHESDGVG